MLVRLTALQEMDPHQEVFGEHELDLIDLKIIEDK